MSDLGDDEYVPVRRHRCAPKRKRRGRPRVGERADCECGTEYVWTETPFQQWLPVAPETLTR